MVQIDFCLNSSFNILVMINYGTIKLSSCSGAQSRKIVHATDMTLHLKAAEIDNKTLTDTFLFSFLQLSNRLQEFTISNEEHVGNPCEVCSKTNKFEPCEDSTSD